MGLIQRVLCEAEKNYIFFATLTYDNAHLPVVTTSSGYDIRFADVRDLQLLFKRLRDSDFPRKIRYFAVSELGSKKGRPHFHALILVPRESGDSPFLPFNFEKYLFDFCKEHFAKNVGSRREPVYEPLFTYVRRYYAGRLRTNYDLHYVNPRASAGGVADVGFYCLKYMLKPSDRATKLQQALRLNLDEEEYSAVWNLVKPRYFASKYFGFNADKIDSRTFKLDPSVIERLRSGVKTTPLSSPFPYFYKEDGTSQPLSRYYKRHPAVFNLQDAHDYYYLHDSADIELRNKEQDLLKFVRHETRVSQVDDSDTSALLDWIE